MREYIEENGKFLKFKLSTTAVGGRANLEDQTTKYFGLGDLQIVDGRDEYSIFPALKLTDDIHVLGNFFSTNYEKAKSFTKLELKVDMLEVYLEAQLRVNEAHEGEPISFCNKPDPTVDPPAITFHEKFKDDILAAYANSYKDNFDQCSIESILALENEIDENIDFEKSNAADDEQLHPDFQRLYGGINAEMPKCFESGNSIVFFKTEFKAKVQALISEIKKGLAMDNGAFGISLLDSLIFSIKDSEKRVVVSQDKLDFDCLIAATKKTYVPGVSSKEECTQTNMIVEFQIEGGDQTGK